MVTDATNKPKPERRSLVITSYVSPDGKPEHWGDRDTNQKLRFKAWDGKNEYLYDCIRNTLFDSIKPGETIDADVQKRSQTGNDGEIHTYRSVVQIYKDGQPVGGQKGKQFSGGYSRNMPEDRQLERERTAFNGIMALLGNKVMELNHPVSVLALKWAETYLSGTPSQPSTPAQKTTASEGTESPKSEKKTVIETPGQLCAYAYAHGKTYNSSWVCKQLNVTQPGEITDIPNAVATLRELTGWTD